MSYGYTRHSRRHPDQRGLGNFGLIAIMCGLAVLALALFLFTSNGNKSDKQDQTDSTTTATDGSTADSDTAANSGPAFIRIPNNSLIYSDQARQFTLAYPSTFGDLSQLSNDSLAAGGYTAAAESAIASSLPIGSTGTVMDGTFGVYVYEKDTFKVAVGGTDIYAGPTQTGDDITWKIVSRGSSTSVNIGDAYNVGSTTSQTGDKVFNFTQKKNLFTYGRFVFAAGDFYVMVTLPAASLPSGTALTDRDIAAYNVIGANIASTVQVKKSSSSSDSTSSSSSSDSSSDNTTAN